MKKMVVRQPGVEPGSTAWKATMLTVTPLTRTYGCNHMWSMLIVLPVKISFLLVRVCRYDI